MTSRSIILGFAAAVFICGVTYFNDHVLQQTFLIGNHLPLIVFGGLILFLLLLNPVLAKVRLALGPGELTVILAMSLAVAVLPSSGFLRGFTASVILPHHHNQKEPSWRGAELLQDAPDVMLADLKAEGGDPELVDRFISGNENLGYFDVLTAEFWTGLDSTMAFWIPLVLVFWAGLVGLALVLHQQWAHFEHLPYPIARIADSLLPDKKGGGAGSIFADRGFQVAMLLVFAIHFVRYLYAQEWAAFDINLQVSLQPFVSGLPGEYYGPFNFLNFTIFFTIIGVSYFLARDVSFSLGIGPIFWVFVSGTFAIYGTDLEGGGVFAPQKFLMYGAYFGLAAMVFYTGRFFYKNVFLGAIGVRTRQELESYSVWGMRLFLLSMVVFTITIWSVGLDWQLAILFTVALLVVFVGMSRVIAETGLFWIQPLLFPGALMLGLFGAQSLGPEMILIMGLLGGVLVADPREAFMPYIINAIKIVEQRKVPVGRTAGLCLAAVVVGLVVAVPATLYWQFSEGSRVVDNYVFNSQSTRPFKETLQVEQRLQSQGKLAEASSLEGWERLGAFSPDWSSLTAFGFGVALVVAFAFARLRLTKWPLHPVLFLVWTTWAMTVFALNFLIGWFIKTVVMKYGGESAHQRMRPIMIGLIAGELLGALVPVIISISYYFVTGDKLEKFTIFPN